MDVEPRPQPAVAACPLRPGNTVLEILKKSLSQIPAASLRDSQYLRSSRDDVNSSSGSLSFEPHFTSFKLVPEVSDVKMGCRLGRSRVNESVPRRGP